MIDWTKPVETDEDEPKKVRVLCTDADESDYPVVVLMPESSGAAMPYCVSLSGRIMDGGVLELRNVRPKKVKKSGWIYLCRGRDGVVYTPETEVVAAGLEEFKDRRHWNNVFKSLEVSWEEEEEAQ